MLLNTRTHWSWLELECTTIVEYLALVWIFFGWCVGFTIFRAIADAGVMALCWSLGALSAFLWFSFDVWVDGGWVCTCVWNILFGMHLNFVKNVVAYLFPGFFVCSAQN